MKTLSIISLSFIFNFEIKPQFCKVFTVTLIVFFFGLLCIKQMVDMTLSWVGSIYAFSFHKLTLTYILSFLTMTLM